MAFDKPVGQWAFSVSVYIIVLNPSPSDDTGEDFVQIIRGHEESPTNNGVVEVPGD